MCRYPNREDALVSWLYGDGGADRAAFADHLASCAVCRLEVDELGGVRTALAEWAPPEPRFANHKSQINPQSPIQNPKWFWSQVPVWAQVAAAMLVLGVSAGAANLRIHYDASGLSVTTGWLNPQPQAAGTQPSTAVAASITREDLVALERQLRGEIRASQASVTTASGAAPRNASADDEVLRRVRAMVDASERRQQNEIALRLAEFDQDVKSRRAQDLVRIGASLGRVQSDFGTEVIKQRQVNDLLYRASFKQ